MTPRPAVPGWRGWAGPAGWVLALVAAAMALELTGRGLLAAPPLGQPSRWAGWLHGRDPVIAAFALLRLAALVALWYLSAVTVMGLSLRLGGAVRLVAMADCLTIAPVRRVLAGTVSLGLAASGVLAVATPAARLPIAAAAQAGAPPATTGPGGTVTMHQLSPVEPAPALSPLAPATAAPVPGVAVPDRWTVEPGQCFWSIAERVLTSHLGHAPGDAEIVPYWRRLIAANRATLAHQDNPDLIFPGQVFEVPAP